MKLLLLAHSGRGATAVARARTLSTPPGCALIITEMKEIQISKGAKTQVDDEDYDFLMQWRWHLSKDKWNSYVKRNEVVNGKHITIRMARVLLKADDPKIYVDHIDHNGLNNQKSNLRLCTSSQNQFNCRSIRSNKRSSIYIDISPRKPTKFGQKWRAKMNINGKTVQIGEYFSEYEAAIGRDRYILDNNLEFPTLNILTRP